MHKNEEIQKFFEGWELYKKVIENNYMVHNEVIEILTERLGVFSFDDLSVLELGCGDAYTISRVMESINVYKYCGIDLSKIALEFAEENLRNIVDSHNFIIGDMVTELNNISEKYDVVLAGYSLHHLERDAKKQVLHDCKNRLNRNGKLLVYDLVFETTEDPEQFLTRCVQHFEKNWMKMTNEQHIMIREHVLKQDIPESLPNWQELALKSGFKNLTCQFRDNNKMYALIEFSI